MLPASVVRRGLDTVSNAARPSRNVGTSRMPKSIASAPSHVRIEHVTKSYICMTALAFLFSPLNCARHHGTF